MLRRTYNQSAEVDITLAYLEEEWKEDNVTIARLPSGPLNATKPEPVVGVLTDWTTQRVVQNREATVMLVVLLSGLLVLNSLSIWRRVGGATDCGDVLREDPGSIAAMARLVEGSNLNDYLSVDGEGGLLTREELCRALTGKRLRLGFFCRPDSKELRYGIYVEDDTKDS